MGRLYMIDLEQNIEVAVFLSVDIYWHGTGSHKECKHLQLKYQNFRIIKIMIVFVKYLHEDIAHIDTKTKDNKGDSIILCHHILICLLFYAGA